MPYMLARLVGLVPTSRTYSNRALELAVEVLHPDMPLLPMGEHWNPTIPQPLPVQHPPVQREPVARPKVKAYLGVGVNQGFRAPADAARQPPPPPRPPKVAGGAQGVAIVSILSYPLVGAMFPHASQLSRLLPLFLLRQWGLRPRMRFREGRFRLLFRQWGLCPHMRVNGRFRHIFPPVGSKGSQADLMELRTCFSPSQYGSLLRQPVLLPRSRLLKSLI